MSRSIVHVLLSLLLLLAQQASLLHVATDWGGALSTAAATSGEAEAKPGKLPGSAAHDACALCMDSAQLAFALPLPVAHFLPLTLSFDAPRDACRAGIRLLATWTVQPRGPPQA